MSNFPNGKPKQMNGAHRLFAQARELPTVQAAQAQAGNVDAAAASVIKELIHRATVDEHRVTLVRDVIAKFRTQCEKLPVTDAVRMTAERMLDTFEQCITAQPSTQLKEEPDEANAGGTGPG